MDVVGDIRVILGAEQRGGEQEQAGEGDEARAELLERYDAVVYAFGSADSRFRNAT